MLLTRGPWCRVESHVYRARSTWGSCLSVRIQSLHARQMVAKGADGSFTVIPEVSQSNVEEERMPMGVCSLDDAVALHGIHCSRGSEYPSVGTFTRGPFGPTSTTSTICRSRRAGRWIPQACPSISGHLRCSCHVRHRQLQELHR